MRISAGSERERARDERKECMDRNERMEDSGNVCAPARARVCVRLMPFTTDGQFVMGGT